VSRRTPRRTTWRGLFSAAFAWLALGVLSACGLLSACSDNSDLRAITVPAERYNLFPADTPLLLQWRGGEGLVDIAFLQAGDLYRKYSPGLALAGRAVQIYIGQSPTSADQFGLVADFGADGPGPLADEVATGSAGRYRGQRLESVDGTDLLLARLDRAVWVIATRGQMEVMLDVALGDAPGFAQGMLSTWLPVLDTSESLAFLAALPGTQGAGPLSARTARAAYGSFTPDATGGIASGGISLSMDNALDYQAKLLQLAEGLRLPPVRAVGDALAVDLAGLSSAELQALARTLFVDMEMVSYTEEVGNEGNDPWLNFRVGVNPNSIFINFEFSGGDARAAFEAEHLPRGFRLAPLRILAADEPRYYLVLNIYQSSGGLVEGARAEWSVFVEDPDTGEPRFLVIQAAAESISADSVNLLTDPEPVSHRLKPDAIESYVGVVDEESGVESTYFRSTIPWPAPSRTRATFAREFAVANDFIYWGNAVADRTLYSASVYNVDAVVFGPDDVPFEDFSPWAAFVNAQPVHTLVYQNPLDIVISPWWNLDADYLDVTPEYRQTLLGFKQNFYPATVQGLARSALRGEGAALLPSVRGPMTQVHFRLLDPWTLLAMHVEDETPEPLAIAPVEGEAPDYFLTVTIDSQGVDSCGSRAHWSTLIAGTDGAPQTLVLERVAAQSCLDPIAGLAPAGVVSQNTTPGERVSISVAGVNSQLQLDAELAAAIPSVATLDWLEAAELECWKNGVCQRWFHDGAVLRGEAHKVPAESVATMLVSPWSAFIEAQPALVTVYELASLRAVNPWFTVPAFTSTKQ